MATMMRSLACAALIAGLSTAVAAQEQGDVQVETRSGLLIGAMEEGLRVFKGVPYAQPPVGALRWRAPQAVEWTDAKSAKAFAPACLQQMNADGSPNRAGATGVSSEDCLYLNVWAPEGASKAPIMVWLYGGGGVQGSGHVPAYQGHSFARNGVVLVTLNYRLGTLAGFAHPALTAEAGGELVGNYHLMDALAAVDWIRANADAFGGDADNVTIFGESAGATMVGNLVASPLSKGRFAKAIIQSSGSLPTPAPALARAEQLGAGLATALGLPGAEATAEQLRAIPGERIIADPRIGFGLRTIIDGTLLTANIVSAFEQGTANDILLMLGTNSDEGRLAGTHRVATAAMSGAPVWQYFFDYVPEWRRDEQPNGVPHAGEIPYVFNTLKYDRAGDRMQPSDHAVASDVQSCWIAFARLKRGDTALTCAGDFVWPARTEANQQTVVHFEAKPRLGTAQDLRSPPNGAAPGPTSRDED